MGTLEDAGCAPEDLAETLASKGAQVWCPFWRDLTPDRLARAQDLGLLVHVWTVNDAGDIAAGTSMGVNAIINDYPGRAVAALAGMGLSAVPRISAGA